MGSRNRRTLGGGARAISLVHAAPASRYKSEARAVHQTRDGGDRPRLGDGPRAETAAYWRRARGDPEDHPARHRHASRNGGRPMTQRIRVIDSHTGGEPTRVIVDGGPDLGAGPIPARLDRFRRDFDHIRSSVVNEPRGNDAIV